MVRVSTVADLPILDTWRNKILDIIFISYDEPNADKNWQALKSRFPHAKRVHGVKGIANAHIAASKKANTSFFYVVDADAEILEGFKFGYKPPEHDSEYVHIWHAFNPATGHDYGYGGVKLFNKKHFRNVKNALDFSTTLTKDVKIVDEIACITRFNSDAVHAFRGAFRESVKLFKTINDENKPTKQRTEAQARLDKWLNPIAGSGYEEFVKRGAEAGIYEASVRKSKDLAFINDHDLLASILSGIISKEYPEIDQQTQPILYLDHPMKSEFFFTTRIASVLYDEYVLRNLPVTELRDALSDGQLYSKTWLVDTIFSLIEAEKINLNGQLNVVVLGGWIGLLPLMMFARELPVKVVSVDLDMRANTIAEKINWDHQFSTLTQNMYSVDYSEFDVIINTSSEHIDDIEKWRSAIPPGKILITQNNDYEEGEGHVSTVENSNQLRSKLNLKEVYYEGTRTFSQYSRFMIIGKT